MTMTPATRQASIDALTAKGDLFTKRLFEEKKRVGELGSKLSEVNSQIATLRESNKERALKLLNRYTTTSRDAYQRVDGLNPATLVQQNQRKVVKKLENQLGKQLVRRSQEENANTAIKETIDKRRRKNNGEARHRQVLEKELVKVRESNAHIMVEAAAVAAERDRLIDRRNEVIQEDAGKQFAFQAEYNRICIYIADQARALEKSIGEAADDVTAKLNLVATKSANDTGTKLKSSSDNLQHLQDKIDRISNEYKVTEKNLRETRLKIHHFESKFQELRRVSGLAPTANMKKDLEDIIAAFVKREDDIFSTFSFIQEMNRECDLTIESAIKLREEIKKCKNEQTESEDARSAAMNIYKESLREVQQERQRLYETNIAGRRTIEVIAQRVTALYFKLKCQALPHNDESSRCNLPPALQIDRKLTTVGGGQVSEKNILNLLEAIETRSIQIVDAYLSKVASQQQTNRSRRPSLILSPKSFVDLSGFSSSRQLGGMGESGSKTESSSSSPSSSDGSSEEGDDILAITRPMSVQELRKEMARPRSANKPAPHARLTSQQDGRHTVI